jgi:hypothetical protein
MGHTFLSVSNDPPERMIAAPDSILEVFMYLWLESIDYAGLTAKQQQVYWHYWQEMPQENSSCMDLWLEEIYANPSLTKWYLGTLVALKAELSRWVPKIDYELLNGLNYWSKQYTGPFPVIFLYYLINDLQWLFYQEGVRPSEHFKWFAYGHQGPFR